MKKKFSVEIDGAKVEFAAKRPDRRVLDKAELVKSRAFKEAAQAGAIVRAKVEDLMREQNLWDDEKQAAYETLLKALLDGELRLQKGGGAGLTKKSARALCLQMRRDRAALRDLTAYRTELDLHTAEAHAENARFNYLVSACTVYGDTGKPYFESHDDYLSREDDPVAGPAATALGQLIYGLDDDFAKKFPENAGLIKLGAVDDKLRLIDKDGNLVDAEGRRVDEKGRLVNEKGELVDANGVGLTEDGQYKVEFEPFLDDEGEPALGVNEAAVTAGNGEAPEQTSAPSPAQ